ncbi:MAG: hypothetical protein CEE42_15640 [Promethearchaeota archaeon Loki_b31]|nr:MAG: hypothetical protein CEE42_15640 [Candidatus Lokiarchaeota archaeon Loki_b31]
MSNNTEVNLLDNYTFFVIPSWGNLLDYPTLGKYANHKVSKITQDLVIFFGGSECAVSTERGTIYYLFGIGYYYTKFELQSGSYIIDNRQLTGLILSDFLYDHLATSKNITLENDRDVIVSENLFKLPIDLSYQSETKRTFIQGTLMRNLFIPYKDIFLELMETLKKPQSFQIDKTSPMLLSTHWDFYNQILISSEMDHELKANYTSPTAGLNGIKIGAKNHLKSYFSQRDLQYIQESTLKLKRVYSMMEYDPMYLFSIIRNASALLRSEIVSTNFQKSDKNNKKILKESIFISAEPQINSFVNWPEQFRRKTKDELEKSVVQVANKIYQPNEVDKSALPFKEYRNEQYQFEIRTMKRPIVELKPLPNMPTSNSLDILLTVKDIVNKDYDVRSIGKALEIARDYIKSMLLHSNILWDMSKFANIFQHTEPNLGLSPKEKFELIEKINKWINLIKKR